MRKILLSLFFGLLSLLPAGAENYPYRSDYLFVTRPDHPNWLYKTGEKPKVTVEFYKYGVPRSGKLAYTIGNDQLTDDETGTVEMKDGRATITMNTRRTPGFRDLRLQMNVDGTTYTHHIKVGFDAEKITPWTQEPSDFTAFWEKTLADMRKKPLSYTREHIDKYSSDKFDCWLVKLNTVGVYSVYGYLFIPKNAAPGSCPAVLCPPGAGVKTIKEPLRHHYYAENGFIRMEIEIHGLDPRMSDYQFKEISNALNSGANGYVTNRIDSRDDYYMRHVYAGVVRCLDFLCSLPEWDGRNLSVQGGSQGGALSIVAAALDKRVTQCVVNHPALADMAAFAEKGRTGGWPGFNKIPGVLTKQNIATLAYYDVVNFARHVQCPVYMTWGYNDNTVPPTTSWAVWNTLKCPKESLITPINEHWTSEATEYGHMIWIKKHLK